MVNLVRKYPPLRSAGRADHHPLSYQQERLYYLSQIVPDSSVWNLVTSRALTGNLQIAAMKTAVAELAGRHPVLRSVIDWRDDAPCQNFARNIEELFVYSDLSALPPSERSRLLQEQLEELWYQPIRLNGEDLLFRAMLIRTEEEQYVMVLKLHHIIADGTTLQILWRDLKRMYNALLDGIPADLPALMLDYGTYARWQRESFAEEFTKEQESYWLKEFQGELPVLDLPADFHPPVQLSFNGALTSLELPEELVKLLRIHCMKNRVILFSGLMAVFYTLLHKLAGQEDIVVGTVFNGRHYGPEFNHPAGFFVNMVAVRLELSGELTYTGLLKLVHEKVDHAYNMQDYPFERLIRVLNPDRDNNRIPLFRTMFNMVSEGTEEQGFLGLEETRLESDASATQTDLLFDVRQEGSRTFLWAEYNTELFREETVKRLLGMYLNLLRQIVLSPESKLEELELASLQEQEQVLKVFNDTKMPYPADKCIHELFAEQVERSPDKAALCYGDRQWTYSEVNAQAGRLAGQLHREGLKPGSIVGILAERSPELVIGLLGILQAGAAYLPLDPAYPEERNRFMLEDSGANILLVQSGLNTPAALGLKTLVLDEYEAEDGSSSGVAETPIQEPLLTADEERLAYVMYTSGSTGTPKGVMIEHRNVVRLVHDGGFLTVEPEDRLLLTGSPSFDAVTFEIWGSLLNGIPLYVAGDDTLLQAARLSAFIQEKRISLLWLTAALFQQLAEENPGMFAHLRCLFVGGDQLPVRQIRQVREACPGLRLMNLYGPTENTTFSTCYPIETEPDAGIPIGKPIPNSTAYILDNRGQLQPVGVPGELYVGGDGLARGYLNRPELTAERFVPDPFHPGQRIYKTGDRAKWLPDGNIAFLGRLDNQVKIRGYRVEPGEIETRLQMCSAVTEAAVVAREDREGSKYLCAYVVCAGELEPAIPEIREFLNESLPGYMVPSVIIPLAKLPLTRNGKVDRKQLPVPVSDEPSVLFRAPGSAAEKKLAEIWGEVLNREQVGADDHFFTSGGHSLKAMVLLARINQSFQVELPLREIFQAPTVSGLAARIEALLGQGRTDSERGGRAIPCAVPRAEGYPASASQKRMYVLHQMMPEGIGYNVPLVLRAEGTVDAYRLEAALNLLLKRHESLRTSFHMVNGELRQRVAEDVGLQIEYGEVADEAEAGCQVQALIRPFALSQAPLMRAALIKVKDGSVFLVLDTHHIVTDGVSSGILLRDLSRFYGAAAAIDSPEFSGLPVTMLDSPELPGVPETKLDYKDFAVWQHEHLGSEAVRAQEAYWLEKLQGDLPVLNLPADYLRPSVQSFVGDRLTVNADEQLYERLKKTAADNGATLYMILLAGYQVLLSKYSGQEDILVGTPIAGRQHADVQDMVGMFVNTLVMRGYPRGSLSFREFLEEVKTGALEAYEHQEVPFEDLVEKVQAVRDMSRNPLFDTMFALQNTEQSPLVLSGVIFRAAAFNYPVSKFDLTLTAEEGEAELRFEWEYAVKLFRQETVARMAEHYVHVLEQVTENPDQLLSAVGLTTAQEQEQILKVFNNTAVPYPPDKCIHELFTEQVKRTPDKAALLFGNQILTYSEMDKQINRLAWYLRDNGIQTGSVVAIIAERSVEMVNGIYAILKAGAAYLPIDPGTPPERIHYMLEDSGTRHVLIHRPQYSALADAPTDTDVTFHLISSVLQVSSAAGEREELNVSKPDDLAYIIYTSGSTGKPKGVMIEHRSLVNTLLYLQESYPLTAEGTYLFKTAFTFDVSATELFGWFFQGGRLAILEPGLEREPRGIMEAIRQHKVTHMNFSPSMLDVFLQAAERRTDMDWQGVEYVFAAGEALKPHVVERFYERISGVRLENIYGPTEITIYGTAYSTQASDKQGNIPIGTPIANMKAYIFDKQMRLQPPGVAGELCFSGIGLARGYLNQAEMTKERFVSNPVHPSEMLYRTGDLARWRDDGNIEYLGRLDQQVKVRGYRIEPGEIEQTLLRHPDIRAAVVTVKESSADLRRLLAYLVLRDEGKEDDWACYLRRWLPSYMIPEAYVMLKEIPLNASGKADVKRLPDSIGEKNIAFTKPLTLPEIRLVQLIEELLQIQGLGISDNLFDCGANSIVLVQLAMLLEDEFDIVLSIVELMGTPTAAAIFEKISLEKEEVR